MGQTVSGANLDSGYRAHPEHKIDVVLCPALIEVIFNGEPIASSEKTLLLTESRHGPVYYFPREDVNMRLLEKTDAQTVCPFKGAASYWSVVVGERMSENAVWSYEDPLREVAGIQNYMAFYWDKMDDWRCDGQPLKEDEGTR